MSTRARWIALPIGRLREQIDRETIDEADALEPDEIPGAIMVSPDGAILDGFHRAAGVCRTKARRVPVIEILDDELAIRLAEANDRQEEAIDEAIDEANTP